MPRDYTKVLDIAASIGAAEEPRTERMRALIDALWQAFGSDEPTPGDNTISWIGFYTAERTGTGATEAHSHNDRRLILGPSRNKPACSPIGLHGACGQSLLRKTTLVVRDVAALGKDYIACDPKDRSELVIPVINDTGECEAVLDADSFDVAAFTRHDAEQLALAMERADLLHSAAAVPIDIV